VRCESLQRLVDEVAEAVPGPAGDVARAEPRERLARSLVDACRAYDLGAAASCVRSLARLGRGSERIVVDAVEFLARQQSLEGAIGFPATDDPAEREHAHRVWTQAVVVGLSAWLPAGEP
jgi:hypothetical protein